MHASIKHGSFSNRALEISKKPTQSGEHERRFYMLCGYLPSGGHGGIKGAELFRYMYYLVIQYWVPPCRLHEEGRYINGGADSYTDDRVYEWYV